jgi:hypothetical protein
MERDLNNGDFEEFLRQKADQHKIYPAEEVWKGIYKSLHTRKRWFRIGGSLLFLSALLFINYQFPANRPVAEPTIKPAAIRPASSNDLPEKNNAKNFFISSSIVKHSIPPRKTVIAAIDQPLQLQPDAATSVNPVLETAHTDADTELVMATVAVSQEVPEITEEQAQALNPVTLANEKPVPASDLHHTTVSARTEKQGGQRKEINWLQELAVIKLTPATRKRFNLQFYFSPTVSYRRLTDGTKTGNIRNLPLASSHLGVNYFVDHKPSVGVELGSNLLYTPAKNITLKSGLQMNYSRYNIKAYKFYYEKANIALTTAGSVPDTMSSYTSLRNLSGYSPEALQNQYVQISLPIGAELTLIRGKRLQLNVAGTVQPTYLIFNDTYLLSTDFINYIKEPSLVRKWNVHTSAEAFVSYHIGGMRWQVGPQFRYQTLSSYNDRYPIKEYLIEYGVKFGVSKTIK